MIIKELNHKPELSIKNATVELTYDEVRDIANGFVYLAHAYEHEDDKKKSGWYDFRPSDAEMECFKERKKSFSILFDLVKHGTVTDFTIDKYANKVCSSEPNDNGHDLLMNLMEAAK